MAMFLSYLNHTKEEIIAVYLVDQYGSVFYDKDAGINELYPEERLAKWRTMSEDAGAAPVIQGRHTIRTNSNVHKEVFSVLRTINSVSTLQNIGILVFDVDINLFKGIIDPVNAVTQGNTFIVDNNGDLIYASEDSAVPNLVRRYTNSEYKAVAAASKSAAGSFSNRLEWPVLSCSVYRLETDRVDHYGYDSFNTYPVPCTKES